MPLKWIYCIVAAVITTLQGTRTVVIQLTYKLYSVDLCMYIRTSQRLSAVEVLTEDNGAIECFIDCDSCSWFHGCTIVYDSNLKWGVLKDPLHGSWKKISCDVERWNLPPMCTRGNCACECHILPRTCTLHTRLQLCARNWNCIWDNDVPIQLFILAMTIYIYFLFKRILVTGLFLEALPCDASSVSRNLQSTLSLQRFAVWLREYLLLWNNSSVYNSIIEPCY